jgi:hypothetical protein
MAPWATVAPPPPNGITLTFLRILTLNSSHGSIIKAIAAAGEHDQSAAELIWQRFFDRLCSCARSERYDRHRRLIAPDEIAANAFLAIFTGLKERRFEKFAIATSLCK